jgi:hypothetical protein
MFGTVKELSVLPSTSLQLHPSKAQVANPTVDGILAGQRSIRFRRDSHCCRQQRPPNALMLSSYRAATGSATARHPASGGLLLRSSASLCPALLHALPQAVGLDQHILRISQLLLPHVAKSAKVGPVLSSRSASRSTISKLTSARLSPRLAPPIRGTGCGAVMKSILWNESDGRCP